MDCSEYEWGGLCLSKAQYDRPCMNGNYCCNNCDCLEDCKDVCEIYQEFIEGKEDK
jgi:hypothetical protein